MSSAIDADELGGNVPALLPLHNHVQHYAWGDPRFIPSLLGVENPDATPFAELWMGAHPDLPSEVELDGKRVPLDRLIELFPEQILGPGIAEATLPYLFKVLSAGSPLSIQVHPSKQSAAEGFAREEAAGISLSAPERNYRDRNHKPELIVALTDFYALRGFRPLAEIAEVIGQIPEVAARAPNFEPTERSTADLYESLMTLRQEQVDSVLDPYLSRLEDTNRRSAFTRDDRGYWLLRCNDQYGENGHHDRGLFSILLLNLIRLAPGEALALQAGVLHAYLEGAGMELMANSNNVIRGGLTPKHVDVPELLRNVTFAPETAECLQASRQSETVWAYETLVEEFALWRIELTTETPGASRVHQGAAILFVASAAEPVSITTGSESIELKQGEATLACHGVAYEIHARGKATLFEAAQPST